MARRNLSYLKNLLLFIFGLPCGAFTGLTGIGTSVLLLPMLRYLLAMRGSRASGVTLAVTFFAALTGLLSFGLHHEVRWGLGVLLAVGQFVGAILGQRLSERVPAVARPNMAWVVLIILIGVGMSANAFGWPRPGLPWQAHPILPPSAASGVLFWGSAVIIALAVGLVSRIIAFGGVLLVPAAIYGLHLVPQMAEGTALFVLLLASLPGMLIHAQQGDLDPQPATWISIGAVFGALVGAFYGATVLSPVLLLLIYGLVLVFVGLAMLWRRDRPADAP